MAEGFAGQVGGQAVEDQISTGGAGGDVAVVGVEGHTGHLFFMILGNEKGGRLVTTIVTSNPHGIHVTAGYRL